MSMKEDRAREGKKARYRKMGFGPAMDRGVINFGDKHPLTKKRISNFKKKDDSPMSDERFYQQRKKKLTDAGVPANRIDKFNDTPNKLDASRIAKKAGGGMSSGQGYGAARTSGMGLQDESVQPGKVQKAALGLMLAKKAKDKGAQGAEFLSPMAMLKRVQGNKTGGVMKANEGEFIKRRKALRGVNPFSKIKSGLDLPVINSVKPAVGVLPKVKHPFEKKGADKFTKLKTLGRVVGSSRVGKIALGIGAAGLGAKKYLESKMKKKDEPKKKMGGGMMKKYSVGGGADMGKSPTSKMKVAEKVRTYALANSMKDKDRLTNRDIELAKESIKRAKGKRALQGFSRTDPMPKKMGGGMMKKYSKGMSYKDMAPYGGKYAKIKKDMRDTASENVKRLTTQSDAYDPETRYVTASQRKGNSRRRRTTKTTDQVYLKGVANKMKQDMGSGTSTSILTPSQARERGIIRPERRRALSSSDRESASRPVQTIQEKLDRRPPKRSLSNNFNIGGMTMMQQPIGFKSGTMVKARGCKLGRTRPTKIT